MDELTQKEKINMGLAGVVIISCFLPWATVSSIFGSMSFTPGLQGEGFLIVTIMSLFMVGLILGGHKARKYLTIIGGLICLGIFAIDFIRLDELTWEITAECEGFCYASVGVGLILGILTSAGLIILSLTSDIEVPEEWRLPDAIMANITYCPSCGKQNKRTDRFCVSCGTRLEPY